MMLGARKTNDIDYCICSHRVVNYYYSSPNLGGKASNQSLSYFFSSISFERTFQQHHFMYILLAPSSFIFN